MTFRKLLFWPHLLLGLLAGLVILVMAVTGVLLTYERQLIAWSDSAYRSHPPSPDAPRLTIDRLVAHAEQSRPDRGLTAVTLSSRADAPLSVTLDQQPVYVDVYTGRVLGDGSLRVRRAMSEVREWHRWLAADGGARTTARAVTGWANVAFALLAASGLYLWVPRTRAQLRAAFLLNLRARGKARDFNWHTVVGFWSAVPLFIVAVSAIPISFPVANAAIYRAMGEAPPAARGAAPSRRDLAPGNAIRPAGEPSRDLGRPASGVRQTGPEAAAHLEPLFAVAAEQVREWRTITLRVPAAPRAAFTIDRGDGGQPHLRSTVTLDRSTAEVVSVETFSAQSPARRLRSAMRFAHTGELLGLPGQTIAGLASAGATVLVWTGFALAWRRCRAWSSRRLRRSERGLQSAGRSAA